MRPLLVLTLFACDSRPLFLELPQASPRGSELLILGDSEPRAAFARDLSDPSPINLRVEPETDRRIEVWISDRELSTFELEPGPVALDAGESAERLGLAFEIWTATITARTFDRWTLGESRWSEMIRFDRGTGCVARGGCFDEDGTECSEPCEPGPGPAPPAPPKPPHLSCAPGWQSVELAENVTACAPWIGSVPACTGDETLFPGESQCHPLGPGCPTGAWPTDLPAGPRLYVRALATGGDGTENAPLGSIQAAIDRSAPGQVIVIGAGAYAEALVIGRPVALVGACPEQTSIAPGPNETAVLVQSPDVSIANLRITSVRDGVELVANASLVLEDAIIEGSAAAVAITDPSRIDLESVLIRGTSNTAIVLLNGAVLRGERVHIADSGAGAILASTSSLTLSDSVVRDSPPATIGVFGRGAVIRDGTSASIRRTVFEANTDSALYTDAAFAELDRIVVRGTACHGNLITTGSALAVRNNAAVTVKRSWVDDNCEINVNVLAGATAILEDTILSRATRKTPEDAVGGVHMLADDSRVHVERVAYLDADSTAMTILGSDVELFDLTVIRAGVGSTGGEGGDAIGAFGLENATFYPDRDLTIGRVRIEDVVGAGIEINGGTATVDDVSIARAGTVDCHVCSGLCLYLGAMVIADRVFVEGAAGAAVAADNQSTLGIKNLEVAGTPTSPGCVKNDLNETTGIALRANGATIDAERFLLQGSAQAGVEMVELPFRGTSVDLTFGTIRDNPIGAAVRIDGYDLRRLAKRVVYDNELNLDYAR